MIESSAVCPNSGRFKRYSRSKKIRYGIAVSEMKKMNLHAEENQALVAINGSFYDIQKGNSTDNGKFDHQGERKIPNVIYVY